MDDDERDGMGDNERDGMGEAEGEDDSSRDNLDDSKDESPDDILNEVDKKGIDDARTDEVTETTLSTDKSTTEALRPTVELTTSTEGDESEISICDP